MNETEYDQYSVLCSADTAVVLSLLGSRLWKKGLADCQDRLIAAKFVSGGQASCGYE
jgi:hypothetical protein